MLHDMCHQYLNASIHLKEIKLSRGIIYKKLDCAYSRGPLSASTRTVVVQNIPAEPYLRKRARSTAASHIRSRSPKVANQRKAQATEILSKYLNVPHRKDSASPRSTFDFSSEYCTPFRGYEQHSHSRLQKSIMSTSDIFISIQWTKKNIPAPPHVEPEKHTFPETRRHR